MFGAKQRGVAMLAIVVGMLAILAVAGLALDASHITYNKGRLQAIVDATALTAAKALDQTGSDAAATAAANAAFAANMASFPEMQRALGAGAVPAITYSKFITPFVAEPSGTVGQHYVRVALENFSVGSGLLRLVGIQTLPVRASAVAGPSPAVGLACNIIPIALCSNATADFGYPPSKIQVLGTGSATTPGTIRYLQFDDTGGADSVRTQLAGGYNQCMLTSGTRVDIKTGVNSGPVTQGINTRFNHYSASLSAAAFPPDPIQRAPSPELVVDPKTRVITQNGAVVSSISQINYNYTAYEQATRTGPYDLTPAPAGTAVFKRRLVAAPMVNCADEVAKTVPVMGLKCLFLLQRASTSGSEADVLVEMAPECEVGGRPGPVPPGTPGGAYVIELYRDTTSPDS